MVDSGGALMVIPSNFRPSSDVVSTRLGEELVLVHLGTEQILVLNRTATRIWDLLCAAASWTDIKRTMLGEFDVTEPQLAAELEGLLATLRSERLIDQDGGA
jgi:coenzyme PQQ synthesis protein D (PqqD)